ncbi:MAG: hypothetical protein ACK6BS_20145, partial [Pseudanabaena sp.]
MSKALNSSLSCLAMFVALSSLYDSPAKAEPKVSDNLSKDSSINLSPKTSSSIRNLIDRQENAVNLQPNLSTASPVSNFAVDKLPENTEVAAVTSVSQLSDVKPTDWA